MYPEQIAAITLELAQVTKQLAGITAKLEEHYANSLNGLEARDSISINQVDPAFIHELEAEMNKPEKQTITPFVEDVAFVKNLDILPRVEVREEELTEDELWEIALAEGINIKEAESWMKAHNYHSGWLLDHGLITERGMVIAYCREYLKFGKK